MSNLNPWKGLSSYNEKDLEQYKFCGRTNPTGRLYSLVTSNLVTTLYGRTGCGKTSLLQAGIFPLLRKESFLPVMCRLSQRNTKDSYCEYIKTRILQELKEKGYTSEEMASHITHVDTDDANILWRFFYGHKFIDTGKQELFPVLILDQFEEILITNKEDALLLLEQLNLLIGDELLLPDDCYSNFRVVISLREDFLYLLEDAIDESNCPLLRENRMRLLPMTTDEARDVIALGHGIMQTDDIPQIEKLILQISSDKRGNTSTNMLSLICSQLFQIYATRGNHERVSTSDLKKMAEDPLGSFYKNGIKTLNKSTIKFIESHLVTNSLRRPVMMQEFEENIPNEDRKRLLIGENRILQKITAGDHECVELLHDTLAKTVCRVAIERKQKSLPRWAKWSIGVGICALLLAGCFMVILKRDASKAEKVAVQAKKEAEEAVKDKNMTELDYLKLTVAKDTANLNLTMTINNKTAKDSLGKTKNSHGKDVEVCVYQILSQRELTQEELLDCDKRTLDILRSAIYASKGYIFKKDYYKAFFSQYSWYNPSHDINDIKLSAIEQHNINLIKRMTKDQNRVHVIGRNLRVREKPSAENDSKRIDVTSYHGDYDAEDWCKGEDGKGWYKIKWNNRVGFGYICSQYAIPIPD